MLDIMVDLETMGVTTNAAIASVGAVAFDPYGDPDWLAQPDTPGFQGFYAVVDLEDACRWGAAIDPATVYWWLKQPDVARHALLNELTPLTDVLDGLSTWAFRETGTQEEPPRWWAKPPQFDLVILRHAYGATGRKVPWRHRLERDVRTVLDLAGVEVPPNPVPHHPLWDAWVQARAVMEAHRALRNAWD